MILSILAQYPVPRLLSAYDQKLASCSVFDIVSRHDDLMSTALVSGLAARLYQVTDLLDLKRLGVFMDHGHSLEANIDITCA